MSNIDKCPKCSAELVGEFVSRLDNIVLICCLNNKCDWSGKYKIIKSSALQDYKAGDINNVFA
jgi:hypothetical protein